MKKRTYKINRIMPKKDKWEILGWLLLLLVVFLTVSYIKMKEDANMDNIIENQTINNESYNSAIVLMQTSKGDIKIEIDIKNMPITSNNFLNLVKNDFYNNLTFHRYVSGFVIQGGDPSGTGTGGSNKTIPLEINPVLKHDVGVIAMARKPDRDSASSQFYFTLGDAHHLDNEYAVFGKIIEGMDNIYNLREKDIINKIEIIKYN